MRLIKKFIIGTLISCFFGFFLSGCCLVTTPAKVALKTGASAVDVAADIV